MKNLNEAIGGEGWAEQWVRSMVTGLVLEAREVHATPGELLRVATGLEEAAKRIRANADALVKHDIPLEVTLARQAEDRRTGK